MAQKNRKTRLRRNLLRPKASDKFVRESIYLCQEYERNEKKKEEKKKKKISVHNI